MQRVNQGSNSAGHLISGRWTHAEAALDSIDDAVLCTDVAGRVTYLNRAAEAMTGWSRAAAAGRPLREVFHRDRYGATVEDSTAPIRDSNGIVAGAVMVFRDVGAVLERSRKALYQAQHDALTHLPSRALLNDHLAQAIKLCKRYDKPLAVGFLDVDGLKSVNDSHGHSVGDRVLSSVASRLRQSLRQSDSVGRVGGDEFVIVLSEIAHDADAALVGQKLLQAVAAPHKVNGRDVTITASLGLALHPDDGLTAKDLIAHADVAMYTAKRGGPGTCQFFQAGMTFDFSAGSAVRNGTAG
jgi:diguanylate cyclase (GGDEF)-like protein